MSDPNDDNLTRVTRERDALRSAIREHRDARGDDRCWLDDQRLYAMLGEPIPASPELPPKSEFLARCEKFYECQRLGAPYDSARDSVIELRQLLTETANALEAALTAMDHAGIIVGEESDGPRALERARATLADPE